MITPVTNLTDQLRTLPDEAFTRLQYLAPATGCFNRCAFCSQEAGQSVWQLTDHGLTSLCYAIAAVAAERGLRIASGRIHRPGVLFPYLDNDVGSYPHLDLMCLLARDCLNVKLRISTVGYSSRNPHLTAMHHRIATRYRHVLDGVRISVTPYTAGWNNSTGTTRQQFTTDLANVLATYRPAFDQLGHGPATAAAELRFPPLARPAELTDTIISGHHVLACGPHLLISTHPARNDLPVTRVARLDERGQPVYTTPGRRYLWLTGDHLRPTPELARAAMEGTLDIPHDRSEARVYKFANRDGCYYAADPDFQPGGTFRALHLYPAEGDRRRSGYTDSARPFLNALLACKARYGHDRRDPFPDAAWDDAASVIGAIAAEATRLAAGIDHAAAQHYRRHVIPLVTGYAHALREAGYPAAVFFSRDFTVDTGQIVNQGRARRLFRGLAATDDEPMTPREERGYGTTSLSSARGTIWRIAPVPFSIRGLPRAAHGGKNIITDNPALIAEELDPRHLRPVNRDDNTPLRRYIIHGAGIEHISLRAGQASYAYPGLTAS
jgi:hypothetical protein